MSSWVGQSIQVMRCTLRRLADIMATLPRNDKSSDVGIFSFLYHYKLISSVSTAQINLRFTQRFRFDTEVRKLASIHSDLRCLFLDGCMWMPFPREPCGWKRNGEGVRRINRFLPFTTAPGSRQHYVLKTPKKLDRTNSLPAAILKTRSSKMNVAPAFKHSS